MNRFEFDCRPGRDQYRYRAGYGPIRKTLCLVGLVVVIFITWAMFSVICNQSVADGYRLGAFLLSLLMSSFAWGLLKRLWLY